MSLSSDFWKELKKLEEEDQATGSTTTKATGSSSKKTSGSVSSDFWKELVKEDDDGKTVFDRVKTTKKKKKDEDIAPVQKKRTWFDTKLFDDGYDFGDVTKTILGTGGDILENLASGVAGMGEKAVDALAYIAPFVEQGQFYQNGGFNLETEKLHNQMVEQSKKDIGKFIAKDLYDEEALVKNATKAILGVDTDDYSILGEKSDSLVQSGGQLLATMGLQAAGVPWFLTTGATSFGSEAENAMNQGASYEEAGASAAISAGAEILSEKLSGGILFGGKALDDSVTKLISRSISNKAARTFAKLGLDMVGEGAEEVFSQVASNLGSALYKDESLEELLWSEEAFDEYLESFIGGAALGGVFSGYNAATSKGDYASGLTDNEYKVVDQLYKERVSEAGEKVSQKEKSKIYDQILSEMEKGYISTDDIERILGGETYNAYQNTVDSEDSVLKEFEELGKKQNATLAEQSRYAELKEQVKHIRENSQRSQLRTKLSEDVLGMLEGDRLLESYNERSRRGQAYEADLTQYDSEQQKVIQKAAESGVLNNTRRTHEFVDIIAKISADKGVLFDFTNNAKLKESGFAVEGKTVNGYVTKDGITLNVDSPKAWQSTVGHEITHVLEGTELYKELQKTLFDYAESRNELGGKWSALKELYKDVKDADVNAELTADLVGEYLFTDEDFINNLSTGHRNVFQKIYDEIKYLYKVATAGSKEARELEKVKKAFDKAYRESAKTQTDTKYSISEEAQGEYADTFYSHMAKVVDGVKQEKLGAASVVNMLRGKGVKAEEIKWSGIENFLEGKKSVTKAELQEFVKGSMLEITEQTLEGEDTRYDDYKLDGGSNYREILFRDPKSYYTNTAMDVHWDDAGILAHARVQDFDTPNGKMLFVEEIQSDWHNAGHKHGYQEATDAQTIENLRQQQKEVMQRYREAERESRRAWQRYSAVLDDTSALGTEDLDAWAERFDKAQDAKEAADAKKKALDDELDAIADTIREMGNKIPDAPFRNNYHEFVLKKLIREAAENGYDSIGWTTADIQSDRWSDEYAEGYRIEYDQDIPKFLTKYGKKWGAKVDKTVLEATQTDGATQAKYNPYDVNDIKLLATEYLIRADEDFRNVNFDYKVEPNAHSTNPDSLKVTLTDPDTGSLFAMTSENLAKFAEGEAAKEVWTMPITPAMKQSVLYEGQVMYSLSDSEGRQLSTEQAEFFKDSKVKDENGNLKVMYHGTPNGDFTVFKDGTYFTDSKEYADRYQNPGASSISTGKVASAPKTFEVYLDIKKPFDINDAEAREIYINDYIKGGNAMGINPYLSDAEYAKINSIDWTEGEDLREFLIENEYDYDGLVLDEGATGGYGDEVKSRGKSYVVFSPEQVKNIDNQSPTSDPDIRFSLSKPVEETKDLMALHNLTEQKLLKSLKLGGLPMPSVAIAKAKDGHSEFGEISLVLPKETIDPQSSSRNKLYSGDAWTPTYPKVDYKLNSKVLKQVRDKINSLVPLNVQEFGRLHLDSDNMEDTLNRYNGDMVDAFKDNDALKYAYLMEAEADVQLPMKEKNLSYSGSRENGAIIKVAESIPAEDIQNALNGGSEEIQKLEPAVRKAVAEYVRETYGDDQFILDTFAPEEGLSFSDLDGYLVEARKYLRKGIEKTVDTRPARELIRDMTVQYSYEEWLRNLFSGIVEKEGIRNNKDYFTPSGNRRSFEALHYEHNLENVIKAMREKGEKGIGFGGGNIFGAATTEFSSVDEMKQSSDRLQHMTEEEYQEIKDEFSNRFFELANSLPNNKSFMATDDAANALTEAVAKYKTRSGIANYLRRELNGWAKYSPQVVDDLIELVNDIRSMPTGYFEAKPQRAVGFDEVGVFVIPKNAGYDLRHALQSKGYSVAEYDPDVEGDRTRVLNQFEDYMFSLSNAGEEYNRYGNFATPATELRYEAPVSELVTENTPTADDSSVVAENATTTPTVSEMETVEFPDDGIDEQAELDSLIAEEAEIRGVMEAYAGVGDIEAVNKLIPEHESIRARIKELQQHESDRADSLDDSDVPPEMDAPLSIKTENYNPYDGVTLDDISRSHRTFSDRNPGARPYIEEAALGFLYDVNNSTHGERWYNDELYYATGGEKGFGGTSRSTTDDIADLKDSYGYTWEQLRKAAEDVVKGEVRSVAAKRVEYLVHKRLIEGYTDVDGRRYEPNQNYITFLNESFANEHRNGSFDSLLENADLYAPPEDIAPLKPATPDTMDAPIFENRDGQTTMFAPEKKTDSTGGKTANVMVNEPKTPKRRNKFWALVKEHVLDNGMVFEDYSKETGNREIEAKWNFIRYSRSRAQRLIGNGTDGVKALKDIKKEVDKSGKTGQFYDYLYHKHNVDRMSLEDRFDNTPNKAVFGDSVTSEVSQRQVEQYEKANPEFVSWAEDVYGYMNHLRNLLVENGVISQETADLWEEMYPHYVPIRRAGQDGLNINVPLDTFKTTVNNPVKRATGGNQDILPLFDTMAQRTIQTYKAIARNSFGIELKNQLGSVVDTNAETVDDVIDGIDTDDALLKPGEFGSNPTFTVFEDGERVEFEITEEMYEAMKPKSEAMQYRNKILNVASSVFRGLTTQYSIPFMATNAIKDAQDVLINSQHPAKTYANFPRAWWQQLTDGKYYQEYVENGGEDNTYFDNETNAFKEDNWFMKGVKFPLTAISTANNFIELTPRLAEYIASREAGRSIEVSMLDAARVTTNFAAGGDVTKFLNSNGATFLNASVQGAIQQVRNVREAHHKGVMGYVGLATKFALAGLPAVLLNNMLWDDDEDYEDLADYVKQDYYVIGKYDDGKFIRIPKGRTVAVIQNAIEQVQNALTGEDEVDLKNFLTLAVNNLAPNNPIENNILAPIMQVAKNKTWYGEDLVPSRLQDLPDAEQFDEKTDSFSKMLGEKWDISPYKINYLLNQYSGGIGDLILPMMTPRAESGDDSFWGNLTAPLRDKFTTDSVINSQVVSDYYDTKDALAVKANSSKATEDDIFRDLYMDTVGYELSDLYKQKREIQNSDMSDSEKYTKSRELQEQIVERMKQSLNSYDNINASGIYAEVGDKRFNKDAESGKWYEIKPKNADGSDNWYYQKEQEVTKGLGISYEQYWNNREEYNFAYDKPGKYAIAQAVGGYDSYMEHYDVLENWQSDSYLSADKDENGNSISGSRKEKVKNYINGLDIDYGEKIILYRTVYESKTDKNTYNPEIVSYLNSRDDISYWDMKSILEELGMEVDYEGNVSW